MSKIDYYEFLQISPNADRETIHRVYRYLGARFHPDNPISGDAQTFFRLKTAYEVLSDPASRSRYDAARTKHPPDVVPMSSTIDFMDSLEGETNRRLAVLSLLYFRRRSNPTYPEVPLTEIETRMGFPRDYLDFTTWYLQKKGYITKADNSDFTLTVQGVDFVETQRATIPILNKLLTNGTPSIGTYAANSMIDLDPTADLGAYPFAESGTPPSTEEGSSAKDRRAFDRRKNSGLVLPQRVTLDRRITKRDRRTTDTHAHSKH
jgi:hypothetical protein